MMIGSLRFRQPFKNALPRDAVSLGPGGAFSVDHLHVPQAALDRRELDGQDSRVGRPDDLRQNFTCRVVSVGGNASLV